MSGKVLLRRGSLLEITLVIYSAVWEVFLILVLGLCSMMTRSKKEVRREETQRGDTHESGANLAEGPDFICEHKAFDGNLND